MLVLYFVYKNRTTKSYLRQDIAVSLPHWGTLYSMSICEYKSYLSSNIAEAYHAKQTFQYLFFSYGLYLFNI
jgi:hypothetical protein